MALLSANAWDVGASYFSSLALCVDSWAMQPFFPLHALIGVSEIKTLAPKIVPRVMPNSNYLSFC